MRTLNDMPEGWRDEDDDWTPGQGLIRGSLWTFVAALVMGALWYWAGGFIGGQWMLSVPCVFLGTWILFEVMHRTAAVVSLGCNVVVILLAGAIIILEHMLAAHSVGAPLPRPWTWAGWTELIFDNYPAWLGIAAATWFCKDGDGALHEIFDLLMVNPFTGRRA